MPSLTHALGSIIGLALTVLLVLGLTNDRGPGAVWPVPAGATTTADWPGAGVAADAREPPPPGTSGAQRRVYRRVYRVTAYCDRGLTAAGTQAGVGQCAAPADIPFGAEIFIPELGRKFIVTDRTHPRFRRNTVDIFIPSRDRCRRFGCQYLECEIRLPADRGG